MIFRFWQLRGCITGTLCTCNFKNVKQHFSVYRKLKIMALVCYYVSKCLWPQMEIVKINFKRLGQLNTCDTFNSWVNKNVNVLHNLAKADYYWNKVNSLLNYNMLKMQAPLPLFCKYVMKLVFAVYGNCMHNSGGLCHSNFLLQALTCLSAVQFLTFCMLFGVAERFGLDSSKSLS